MASGLRACAGAAAAIGWNVIEAAITFEALGKRHDGPKFSCGQADLDDWFRRRAGQDERRNVARVFIAVDSDVRIVGFYRLSASS